MHSLFTRLLTLFVILGLLVPPSLAVSRPVAAAQPSAQNQTISATETPSPPPAGATPATAVETPLPPAQATPSATETVGLQPAPTSTSLPSPTLSALTPTPTPTSASTSPPAETGGALGLTLSAPSGSLLPGENAVLSWRVDGWTAGLSGLSLEINLPKALSPQDVPPDSYDAQSGKLVVPVAAGEGQVFLSSTADAKGRPFTVQASLWGEKGVVDQEKLSFAEEGLNQVGRDGGKATGLSGKVSVDFPAGAADEDLEVRIRRPAPADRPAHSLSGAAFEIIATGKESGAKQERFAQPLTLEVSYDPAQFAGVEHLLQLYYYDPAQDAWLPVESEVDPAAQRIRARVDHLSPWDIAAAGWEAARLPGMAGFQTAAFSGAASYSLSLWTPPGPGGLQPSLNLSYNSQVVDNARARYTQAGWAGMGWTLASGGAIERDQHGTDDTGDDTFQLDLGGTSELLLPLPGGYYHTASENFWRIQYAGPANQWTVWDKQGNQYIFGETDNARATYPAGAIDCDYSGQDTTWRWSLSRMVNVYGKALSYTYFEENQLARDRCDPDVLVWTTTASYPLGIQYPDSPYRVAFEWEGRGDYRQSWTSVDALTFYSRSRLKAVKLLDGTSVIRRYAFSYTENGAIYPNVNWDGGGKTLTLSGVQEFGLNDAAWPAVSFSYDGLHLSAASNGYGGSVAYSYENPPWNDTYLDPGKHYTDPKQNPDHCEPDGNGWRPSYVFGYGGGTTWCQANSQGNNPQLYINGAATLDLPAALLQPGAAYRTYFGLYNRDNLGNPLTAQVGLVSGVGEVIAQTVTNLAAGAGANLDGTVALPAGANTARLYLYCSKACQVTDLGVHLLSTRYRVSLKTLGESTTAGTYVSAYRYDEPALNDAAHSAAVSGGGAQYQPVSSQFRGHAMQRELTADGRARLDFYRQDDALKGQQAFSLTFKSEYYAGFDDGSYNPADWSSANGGVLSVLRLTGDPALQVSSADSSWRGVRRGGWNLGEGEAVLAQLRVSGSSANARLFVESGTAGTSGYRQWGVTANGNTLSTLIQVGTTPQAGQTLINNFQRDAWYVVLLAIDSGQFLIRAWQRDSSPEVAAQYRAAFSGGPDWRFAADVQNGSAWLDTLQEGLLYSLSKNDYSTVTPGTPATWPLGYSDLKVYRSSLDSQAELVFEGDGEWVGRRSQYVYDAYANRRRAIEQTWDPAAGNWQDRRVRVWEYFPNPGGVYLVGLVGLEQVYGCAAGHSLGSCNSALSLDQLSSSTWYLYDGQASYNLPPLQGKPSGRRSLLRFAGAGYSDKRYRDETWSLDGWGNRLTDTAYPLEGTEAGLATGEAQTTSYTYDTTYHAYRLSESNPVGYLTSWTYNTACGEPTSQTGPNGAGTTVTAAYDNRCRLVQVIKPGDSSGYPTAQVSYVDTAPYLTEYRQRIESGSATTYTLRKYYDGLGRMIQSQVAGAVLPDNACTSDGDTNDDLCDLVVDYSYDRYGNVVKQTMPYAVASGGTGWRGQQLSQPSTLTSYDLLGRLTLVSAPDGTLTSLSYADGGQTQPDGYSYRETSRTDGLGRTTVTRSDLLGRVRQVVPPLGPGVSYAYDAAGRLTSATDGTAVTSLSYDLAGRKQKLIDPDLGTWSYAYDAIGNLTRQADARGQRTCLYYDKLNRLTGKHYRLDDVCPASRPTPIEISYTYDNFVSGSNYGKGYRTGMVDPSGSTAWTYDARGRVIQESKVVTGVGTFASGWTYNSADLPATMTYPADASGNLGETLTYAYQPQLALKTLFSSLNYYYVPGVSYDAAGRVNLRKLGAPNLAGAPVLQTDYDYFAWDTPNGQGRLKQIKSGTPITPNSLLDLRYYSGTNTPAYDAVGNILNIYDYKTGNPQTQAFSYDAMDRLVSASADGTAGNYAESYTYDPTSGNLASKAGVSYTYSAQVSNCQGTPSTHTIAHAVSTVGSNTYAYDCNGNQTQRVVGGSTTTLVYDAENRLVSVSGSTSAAFVYDGDGKRVKGTVNSVSTTYIGDYAEWNNSTNTLKKYYEAGGTRIALREGTGNPVWLLGDHLGSTSQAANFDGTPYSNGKQLYKAWGEKRYPTGASGLPTTYRYTGQREESALGLYWYGSRWYDPSIMRWTSPDQIIPDPYNSLDWDRYAYARNNPVKYVDPDGHFPILPLLGILLFLATLPGDTGPYDVSPSTTAIGNAGLRMVDPVDWVYTAGECFSGNCSGIDIAFGLLPVVNGGLDDAADAARALQGAQTAGRWIQRSEYMSDAARAYQRFISGRADDLVYEIGGYTFDGFDASLGILKEAKDIPANFVNAATNEFKPWVSGTSSWLTQAQNQVNAAGGLKIQWFFNSQAAREAMYNLFLKKNPDLLKSMELIYKPME